MVAASEVVDIPRSCCPAPWDLAALEAASGVPASAVGSEEVEIAADSVVAPVVVSAETVGSAAPLAPVVVALAALAVEIVPSAALPMASTPLLMLPVVLPVLLSLAVQAPGLVIAV